MPAKWSQVGLTTYTFYPHDGRFPWDQAGETTTDPKQAQAWLRAAKPSLYQPGLGRLLSGVHNPRATW